MDRERSPASLAGRVALVTGAGRGIGRALAQGLATAGAAVGCIARSTHEVEAIAQQINAAGGRAMAVTADVTRAADCDEMVAVVVDTFGSLDVLVVNAGGVEGSAGIIDGDVDAWRATLDLNLTGAYLTIRAATPALAASGDGRILTIGSGLGHRAMADQSAYACAKAGLWMLTRVAAEELAGVGVAANELIPGPVDTGGFSNGFRQAVLESGEEWLKQPVDVVPTALHVLTFPRGGPTGQSFSMLRRQL